MFKKMVAIGLLCGILMGCGSDLTHNGKKYETYGLLNKDETRQEHVVYKPIWGNVIWGIILCETIIAPVYFFGFSYMEAVEVQATPAK